MNTNIRLFLFFLESIFVTSSDIPSKTGKPSVMEFLDSEYVLVDYSASFDIPDFSIITAVSVYKENKIYGIANRDYTDGDNDRFNDRFYQPLVKNSKIKAKLDPCFPHSFYVRIIFNISVKYDHLFSENEYNPDNFSQV